MSNSKTVEQPIVSREQKELLEHSSLQIDTFINKNYLMGINNKNVLPINEDRKRINNIRLFKVEKLVYDKQENINDKFISVYSALQSMGSSAVIIIDSKGREIDFYIGVYSQNNASISSEILEKSFLGNFAGSTLIGLKNDKAQALLDNICIETNFKKKNISSVSVIPAMRDDDKDKFVQGMEKFIDTMQGEEFTAIFIAEPISKEDLEVRKRGFEEMYSSLSPFAKTTLSYGKTTSNAVTNGSFNSLSNSINNSVSNTTSRNNGTSNSITNGTSTGTNFGLPGFGFNQGRNRSTTQGYSSGQSWSNAVTSGTAETQSSGTNIGETITDGENRNITVEHKNKSIELLLTKIDNHLKRIDACEAFGVWECAAYFISSDVKSSVVAANTYKALMIGDGTEVENSFINVWINNNQNKTEVLKYLNYCSHPLIEIGGFDKFSKQYVTPSSIISGKELPLFMGLPHKSVLGLTVSNIAEFGRNVYVQNKKESARTIKIGNIYHMGNVEHSNVNLDLDSLTSHCFITGSTGSGKSYTTYLLIEKLLDNKIPFLVIEPAKGEYKDFFGKVKDINIFTTNPLLGQMLKINPFKFKYPEIHVLEHLDRLIEIFNTCWEMYAAMPAILKDAIEQIYINAGWDLINSTYIGEGDVKFPTFIDLMNTLPKIINTSSYSSDTKGDYIGALVTRVNSLTNGISGQIFCDCYDIEDNILFDQNTIIDLSRVGSSETKSLIMGILVLRLNEYRMANVNGANSKLKHVTILEEAHNLLKRCNVSQGGSNVVAKSVEMICSSIAEMRTYGEGFVIVDQSPTSVDIAAIKNTNTKIVMRLPEKDDCEAIGNAIGLNENQIKELSKLSTGIAVVMQNNWLEAVLSKIDLFSNNYYKKLELDDYNEIKKVRGDILYYLINQKHPDTNKYFFSNDTNIFIENVDNYIDSLSISRFKKNEFKAYLNKENLYSPESIDYFNNLILNLSNMKSIISIMENDEEIKNYPSENEKLRTWMKNVRKKMPTGFDTTAFGLQSIEIKNLILYHCLVAVMALKEVSNENYKDIIEII